MRRTMTFSAAATATSLILGCAADEPVMRPLALTPLDSGGVALPSPTTPAADTNDWTVFRVAGDAAAPVTRDPDGSYRCDGMLIDTPLPDGYPPPTPIGAIELKKYPAVRRAQVDGNWLGPDMGMNLTFWPLFRHIQRRNIAMTSPVEMDYPKAAASSEPASDDWRMAFLYRRPTDGPAGEDGRVVVRDAEPVTVISTGLRGRYSWSNFKRGLAVLEAWLAEHPAWQADGGARALYYNGPDRRTRDQWAEVQVPVRPATPPPGAP